MQMNIKRRVGTVFEWMFNHPPAPRQPSDPVPPSYPAPPLPHDPDVKNGYWWDDPKYSMAPDIQEDPPYYSKEGRKPLHAKFLDRFPWCPICKAKWLSHGGVQSTTDVGIALRYRCASDHIIMFPCARIARWLPFSEDQRDVRS